MNPYVSVITLGVRDMARARQFYNIGLGWPIAQDYPQWVSFPLGEGGSALGLYPRADLAADAGMSPDGDGFGGVTLSYIAASRERVDAILAEAVKAGGSIARPAVESQWAGYFGYFADPEGYLWKVVSSSGEQPFGAE